MSQDADGFHMTPAEFRRHGHAVVDWVADYLERVGELPIQAPVAPGEIAAMLPGRAPEAPEPFEALLADLDDVVLPGITHWQSPGWFAWYPANTSGPSILAELAAAGLGVQGMLWATSPACTETGSGALDWLAPPRGVPGTGRTAARPGGGGMQGSGAGAPHPGA